MRALIFTSYWIVGFCWFIGKGSFWDGDRTAAHIRMIECLVKPLSYWLWLLVIRCLDLLWLGCLCTGICLAMFQNADGYAICKKFWFDIFTWDLRATFSIYCCPPWQTDQFPLQERFWTMWQSIALLYYNEFHNVTKCSKTVHFLGNG